MLWIKALHVIFMVCWFAGLFYLPRLFVYHAMAEDTISQERFKIMERKLFWGIMTPSGVLTVIFGTWLFSLQMPYYLHAGWFHLKLLLVITLIIYHVWCGKYLLDFKKNINQHHHRFYRYFNEYPVVVLFVVVLLAIVKPW